MQIPSSGSLLLKKGNIWAREKCRGFGLNWFFFFFPHDIPIEIEGPTYEHDSWNYIVVGGQLVATCKRGVNAVLSLNYSHICLQQVGLFMVDRFSSGLLEGHCS